MSKELIQNLRSVGRLWEDEAADTIEAQQSWITSLEQHAQAADKLYKELETELAAAQAQTKVLRDALDYVIRDLKLRANLKRGDERGVVDIGNGAFIQAEEALNQPTDTTALRELLKAERERCAEELEKQHSWITSAAASALIRAMEDK